MIATNLLSLALVLTATSAHAFWAKKFKIPKNLDYYLRPTDSSVCQYYSTDGILHSIFNGKESVLYCPKIVDSIEKLELERVKYYAKTSDFKDNGERGIIALMKKAMRLNDMYLYMEKNFNQCMDQLSQKALAYNGSKSAELYELISKDDFQDVPKCQKLPTFKQQFKEYISSLQSATPGQTLAKDATSSKHTTLNLNPFGASKNVNAREKLYEILEKMKNLPAFKAASVKFQKENKDTEKRDAPYKEYTFGIRDKDIEDFEKKPVFQ